MRMVRGALVLGAIGFLSLTAHSADAALIVGDPADSELGGHDALGDGGGTSTGTITSATNNGNIRVGSGGTSTTPGNFNAVLVFQLPVLLTGESFQSASLQINLAAKDGTLTGINGDLYALGARASSTVLSPGDFYLGAFGGDPTSATPLHDDFLVPTTAVGTVSTSGGVGTGASTLTSYLNNLYATDSSAAGKYLFLRISTDVDPSGTGNRYRVVPANDATVANRPTLDYTTVPEPGAAGVLVGIGLLAASRRRRTPQTV